MAKLYDKSSLHHSKQGDPQELYSAVQSFLSACRIPAVLDFGDEPIRLLPEHYCLEVRSGKLTIDVWEEQRSLSRKILAVNRASNGVLDCTVQRFGNSIGTLSFLDLDRPQTASRTIRGTRQSFAEQFRRMLSRQFPGWQLQSLSSASDLRRSFSANFPRVHLFRGNRHLVAVACPLAEDEPAMLAFALLWFDHCRTKIPEGQPISLCLFLPDKAGNLTARRLRWLTGQPLAPRIFRFNEHGMAGEVDTLDLGNLETRLTSHYTPVELAPDLQGLLSRLVAMHGVGCCPEVNGTISVRFRGLEFARIGKGIVSVGIDHPQNFPLSESWRAEEFARHLSAFNSGQGISELPASPERWFESSVRSHIQTLDPNLLSAWIHGQVLTFAGGERELIDLLAISASGRLSIIELKT
ncbi:MAG: hypothetical protein M3Y24_04130, partial [Acidobacteriota bacterium]|nr:hypothetical protein [Acidobacteriota bacterium]